MGTKKPSPPKTLGSTGAAIWKSITGSYDLRPDELITLEDVCAKSDRIVTLQAKWEEAGCPEETKGSMGQLIEHPRPKAIEKLRMDRNSLLARLKLPDLAPSGEAQGETNQNRTAAQARHSVWSTDHGTGA